jgi:L-lysine exporter family protein LysE/ArgO
MPAFFSGFALSLTLILAIGAQNAFVLRHGLRREHVFAICLLCGASDAALIAAGVAGMGALVTEIAWMGETLRWGGAAFLLWYGARSFRAAWRGGEALEAGKGQAAPLSTTLLTLLALTWLNPHVYLDTVVLIGSISAQYEDRLSFGIGAVLASFTFFFALGYGARLLAPLFAKPISWRILDALIGCTMWAIALTLVLE